MKHSFTTTLLDNIGSAIILAIALAAACVPLTSNASAQTVSASANIVKMAPMVVTASRLPN